MAEIVSPSLGLVGESSDPYSGRVSVRVFPHGAAEAVYIACKGPSEYETLNAWLHDAGVDNRVLAPRRYTAPVLGDGVSPPDGETEAPSVETNIERVARRAKQRIRWSIKAVGADRLLTLTYRDNMADFAKAKKDLTKFATMCRRKWPGFKYVAVPEQQERGAWHWHLAIRGFVNVDALRGFWWRSIGYRVTFSESGKPVLLNSSETPGNVDITSPRSRGQKRRTWQVDKLCAYMGKYLTKAVTGGLDHKASYSVTRGLTWRVERFVVRALDFKGVVKGFFQAQDLLGFQNSYHFQSEDRRTLWAAGTIPIAVSGM